MNITKKRLRKIKKNKNQSYKRIKKNRKYKKNKYKRTFRKKKHLNLKNKSLKNYYKKKGGKLENQKEDKKNRVLCMLSFTKKNNDETLDIHAGKLHPTEGIINSIKDSDESCFYKYWNTFFLPNTGPKKTIHKINFLFNYENDHSNILDSYKLLSSSWSPMIYSGKNNDYISKKNYTFSEKTVKKELKLFNEKLDRLRNKINISDSEKLWLNIWDGNEEEVKNKFINILINIAIINTTSLFYLTYYDIDIFENCKDLINLTKLLNFINGNKRGGKLPEFPECLNTPCDKWFIKEEIDNGKVSRMVENIPRKVQWDNDILGIKDSSLKLHKNILNEKIDGLNNVWKSVEIGFPGPNKTINLIGPFSSKQEAIDANNAIQMMPSLPKAPTYTPTFSLQNNNPESMSEKLSSALENEINDTSNDSTQENETPVLNTNQNIEDSISKGLSSAIENSLSSDSKNILPYYSFVTYNNKLKKFEFLSITIDGMEYGNPIESYKLYYSEFPHGKICLNDKSSHSKDCKKVFNNHYHYYGNNSSGNVSNKSVRDMIIIMPDEVGWIDCNSVSLSKNDMPPFVPPNNPNIPPYNPNIPPYNPNIPGSPEFPNPNNPNVPPSQPDKVPDSDMDVNDSGKPCGWYFKVGNTEDNTGTVATYLDCDEDAFSPPKKDGESKEDDTTGEILDKHMKEEKEEEPVSEEEKEEEPVSEEEKEEEPPSEEEKRRKNKKKKKKKNLLVKKKKKMMIII